MFNYFPDADTQAQAWVALGLATPLVLHYAKSELQTHTQNQCILGTRLMVIMGREVGTN